MHWGAGFAEDADEAFKDMIKGAATAALNTVVPETAQPIVDPIFNWLFQGAINSAINTSISNANADPSWTPPPPPGGYKGGFNFTNPQQ